MLGGVALLLLGLGILAWWLSGWTARRTGLPIVEVVADDVGPRLEVERPMRDEHHGLVGRPDYLIRTRHGLIPVEVKPTRRAAQPYESDIFQVAAYCLLVEAETGQRPPYGLLIYASRQWQIPFDAHLRQRLLQTLAEMRADLHTVEVARSHHQPGRCRACGLRYGCTMALDAP